MRDSTALPNLQMLPTHLLSPHEDCDPRRVERLSKRILEEGVLKNPPIVAPIPGSDRYVILDGANRSEAFNYARIPHIVAQVVSYDEPGVCVDTWHHVVAGIEEEEFENKLSSVCDHCLKSCSLNEARTAMEDSAVVAYIINERGVRMVRLENNQGLSRMGLLNRLVGVYKGRADIFRASNDIWEIQKPFYPGIVALVVYPPLTPDDIFAAASDGEKIPSGITRHIIPARALNINIPIGILMADWPYERKKEWMADWLMRRMAANAIRYYAESTFSFNE